MRDIEREFSLETKAHVENLVEYKCMVCGHSLRHGQHHHDIPMKYGGSGEMTNDVYVCPSGKNVCHIVLDRLSDVGISFRDIVADNVVVGLAIPEPKVRAEHIKPVEPSRESPHWYRKHHKWHRYRHPGHHAA